MIRRWLITLGLLVMVPALTSFVLLHPRPLSPEECGELYQRYADNPDIRATYVKNYHINDTLTLSATLLEAVTDTGWIMLQNDFCFTPYPPEVLEIFEASGTDKSKIVEMKVVLHGTSCGSMDSVNKENNDVVCIYHFNHYIVVINIKSDEHVDAIFYKHMNQLQLQKNEKNIFTSRISNYALRNERQLSERESDRTHVQHDRSLCSLQCAVHSQWCATSSHF